MTDVEGPSREERTATTARASKEESDKEDPFMVRFEEDLIDSRIFSSLYKACVTFLLGLLAAVSSIGSSVVTSAAGAGSLLDNPSLHSSRAGMGLL